MYILAIETTGAFAFVALAEFSNESGFRLCEQIKGHDRFSHLRNLAPQIKAVTGNCGLTIGDVNAIAVSKGPGSFTGIRIGVATARAFAQAAGIECVPVSSLEGLALRGAVCTHGDKKAEDTLLCPILDARRKQVYGGGYFVRKGEVEEEVKSGPYTIDEFLGMIKGYEDVCFVGDGADAYGERIREVRGSCAEFAPESRRYQDASCIAELGAKYYLRNRGCLFEDLEPDYMRLAEAERRLREKMKSNG